MMKLIMLMLSIFFLIVFKNFKKYMMIHLIMLIFFFSFFFNSSNNFFFTKIYNYFMMDYISFILILLSMWMILLSILSNFNFLLKNFSKFYLIILLFLLFLLFLTFSSMNLFMFYLMFESSLIPLIILIMGWGYQINRIQAMSYMLLYTLFGSLPFLLLIFWQFKIFNTMILNLFMFMNLNFSSMFYFLMMMIFLVKLPMYFIHLWLPKAHVEAPISGSMILASIMLKLGIYGIMRFMEFFTKIMLKLNFLFINLMIIGSIYSGFICLNNIDMKIIIAYSSIVHMNFLMASMLMFSIWSFKGSLILMISHGLCSPSMFCLANFFYERSKSRLLYMNKGLLTLFPSMSMWMFLIFSNNFSSPPCLNLMGELLISFKFIDYYIFNIFFLILILLISTMYSIFLISETQFNKSSIFMYFYNMNCREYFIILMHWIPLNLMFLNLNFMI